MKTNNNNTLLTVEPHTYAGANQAAPDQNADSVFVELQFSSELGSEIPIKSKLQYYEFGEDDKAGSLPMNFQFLKGVFDAVDKRIELDLVAPANIMSDLREGVEKSGGGNSQIQVKIKATNKQHTSDKANEGVKVQFFDPQETVFIMNDYDTQNFKSQLNEVTSDVYRVSEASNDNKLCDLRIGGDWQKNKPITTWSVNSANKIAIQVLGSDK